MIFATELKGLQQESEHMKLLCFFIVLSIQELKKNNWRCEGLNLGTFKSKASVKVLHRNLLTWFWAERETLGSCFSCWLEELCNAKC